MKTVALWLNRVSLLCALAFAVIAEAFRCSALWFRCYRITAKTAINGLIKNRNVSNKMAEKAPEKISFPVLSLFRPDNSVNGGIRDLAEIAQRSRPDRSLSRLSDGAHFGTSPGIQLQQSREHRPRAVARRTVIVGVAEGVRGCEM